jgi:hypothetical protein
MTVVQLASAEDVVAALGRDLTSEEATRVEAILDKASELFRIRSGQQFTPGTSEVKLMVHSGEVRLPQRPVTSVASVKDMEGNSVSFTRFMSVLTVTGCAGPVIVNYQHGAATVPDVVRLCIAEIAKKVLSIDPHAASGVTQYGKTSGPFSDQWSYATWAQGGQTMLAPDDAALADTFRIRLGQTIVQQQ